ncbi:isochorismate synthase MenF [Thalassotalea aquiviva]|uniref:isochorismate synthase n=1 Tax=Thalassotalea aquiviva TaxID=3242415 RepID=UPI00352BC36B
MTNIEQIYSALNNLRQQPIDGYHCLRIGINQISLLGWLKAQTGNKKFYWRDKSGDFTLAMLGVSHQISTLEAPNRLTHANYFGGVSFNPKDKQWPGFSSSQFIVPRIEIRCNQGQYSIACHINARDHHLNTEIDACLAILDELKPEVEIHSAPLNFLIEQTTHSPDYPLWQCMVNSVLANIKQGSLQKVVLSRQTTLKLEQTSDSQGDKSIEHSCWDLLGQWQHLTPNCFQFALQFEPDTIFIGSSPEKLFRRIGNTLHTEAMAGTTPIGNTQKEHEQFYRQLINDNKLGHENELVANYITEILEQVCRQYSQSELNIVKLAHVQHLNQTFSGQLKTRVTDHQLLNLLHPTPAVAGVSKAESLKIISQLEPYIRGWYSGAVGYCSPEHCVFSVAIRSALIQNNNIKVFAGAGIVEGSTAELEWHELNNKVSTILSLLA